MKGILIVSLVVISMLASSDALPNPVAAPLPAPAAEPFGPIARRVIANRVRNRVYQNLNHRYNGYGGYGHVGYGHGYGHGYRPYHG